ncbi:tryptophan-rich sensory protein [Chelatococcus sambhunathii]|uniref:Tryptophan-rich sensory protein n=1 Tax=Chelatococcus sambhunathii TaxID=363953 RepID=A0ABU1DJ89_9HYPH|nr:TspO/MBR family protein [Chelatococcus sambhunathii]MDR4308189.1 tryptophan-rich sensory protein [Chelatococcus sambhunathii]
MTSTAPPPRWLSGRSLAALAASVVACFAASQLGALATYPNLGWYEGLAKPWFRPPNWAFPVAWTILYAMMALAAWRVAMTSEGAPRRRALTAFGVQLALNIAWSFAFFAARSPLLGLVDIAALLAAILWTIVRFRPIDGLAAALLCPYVLWVSYAATLNAAILILNP